MKRLVILSAILLVTACNNKDLDQIATIKEVTEYDMAHIKRLPCHKQTDLEVEYFILRCNDRLTELDKIEGESRNKKVQDAAVECSIYIDEAIDYVMTFASDEYINNGI